MTNVERKIASNDTISVSFGHGFFSIKIIQIANPTAWMYTNFIEPANAVIASATRSWMSAYRRSLCSTITGLCWTLGSSLMATDLPLVVHRVPSQPRHRARTAAIGSGRTPGGQTVAVRTVRVPEASEVPRAAEVVARHLTVTP